MVPMVPIIDYGGVRLEIGIGSFFVEKSREDGDGGGR
jgi:hypothetical protein